MRGFVFLGDLMRLSASAVGAGGFKMLFISTLVITLTGGISLLPVLRSVIRVGRDTASHPADVRVVLVPGVRLRRGEIGADFQCRLERALALRADGAAQLVLLGGVTGTADISEAAKGYEYLRGRGIADSAMQLEERSRHTLENLRHARALLGMDTPVTIVSNRYHLARLGIMATGLGMPHRLCAAEADWRWSPALAGHLLREAFYVHWYLTGSRWARLTRDRASQARIS
ncbi:MAG: hypothetical protein CVV05_18375 [Gammaproteobacteria bacterium HGW-Gammaproteobacteria-1]|jgi:uncharacterized SAM-binding protein YcdF (DUF218 family)|nr:MAG: hypothetical protein CVV05_18375 [Gammaproteobacteria bacterium HGW-Gammaproteobacteria-1]